MSDLDAQRLRIRVGVYDDPVEPIADALGTDEGRERALQLVGEDGPTDAHITLDGGLWATATRGEERVEGPADREVILTGLARVETVRVRDYDDAPFTGEMSETTEQEDGHGT